MEVHGGDAESAVMLASASASTAPPSQLGSEAREGGAPKDSAAEVGDKSKKEKQNEVVDPEVANARAKAAQAAECGVVGIHNSTAVVQSEVGCLQLWRDRDHSLLLHKDCLCEMIKHNVGTVILMPQACAGREFPECEAGEIPAAIRVPKDDTQKKEAKEKKEKQLKYPKYAFFRARANWLVGEGTTATVEGVHLGWTLRVTGAMPCGCEPASDGIGLPEPLELLSVDDIRRAAGCPENPDFLLVSLEQHRSAVWKLMHFAVRTIVELVAVYLFMSFLGTEPSTYTPIKSKPWDTTSNHAFSMPGLFEWPEKWRSPGMRPIWSMYMGTFLLFLGLRIFIAITWAVLPARGGCMKVIRHLLAALYPIAVSLPLVLYLVYLTASVVACRQCSSWHCGAYAFESHHLQFDAAAFQAEGGCGMGSDYPLHSLRRFVYTREKNLTEHEHCSFNGNGLFDTLGISLDTSRRDPHGDTCEPDGNMDEAMDKLILEETGGMCGTNFTSGFLLDHFEVTPRDRERIPWTMFARDLPIKNGARCPKTGEGWDGPYIYYEPNAAHADEGVQQGGICVCRSRHGSRDCFRRVPGTVDRCSHFTGQPLEYGGLLQFDTMPRFTGSLPSILTVAVPVFALFTIKAWDDIPLAGIDKFDVRLQSRMKLDVLDFFVFFRMAAIFGSKDQDLPLVKFIFPDMTWHDFELSVWCIAWSTGFVWWSMAIFFRMLDTDPDKTPKKWKNVKDILGDAETTVAALEPSKVADLYTTAVRKQTVLYEKELQKMIKKRTVVDILRDDVDVERARPWHWQRSIIVFSSPKVKELTDEHLQNGSGTFTLYVAGGWPWSASPPEMVWRAESWEEFVEQQQELGACDGQLPAGLRKVTLRFDEVLIRLRPDSAYYWFDLRYLGWFYLCGCQPQSEYKKMKEEDHRIADSERVRGYSETYYNKFKFDFFERNIEWLGACRSLFVDLLFLVARLARGFWGGGFNNSLSMLLVLKNCIFSIFGVVFVISCGNTRHSCGPCRASPAELLAKCIERTKIGNAIKLSMLMPLRICIESTGCCFRLSAETEQATFLQRLHVVALRRTRVPEGADTTELDHEIRLLAGQVEEYQDRIERIETKNIVKLRAKIRAKDILG